MRVDNQASRLSGLPVPPHKQETSGTACAIATNSEHAQSLIRAQSVGRAFVDAMAFAGGSKAHYTGRGDGRPTHAYSPAKPGKDDLKLSHSLTHPVTDPFLRTASSATAALGSTHDKRTQLCALLTQNLQRQFGGNAALDHAIEQAVRGAVMSSARVTPDEIKSLQAKVATMAAARDPSKAA